MSNNDSRENSIQPETITSPDLKSQPQETENNPYWLKNNQGVTTIVAFVLIAIYVSPIYMIGVAAIFTDGFQEHNFLIKWFGAFMHSADSTLNEYHKILFPVMSAVSVLVFKGKSDWKFLSLALFVLLSFVTTLFVSVAFDVQTIQKALEGQEVVNIQLSKHFFVKIQEMLLMYLMMLFGIGVSNSQHK